MNTLDKKISLSVQYRAFHKHSNNMGFFRAVENIQYSAGLDRTNIANWFYHRKLGYSQVEREKMRQSVERGFNVPCGARP